MTGESLLAIRDLAVSFARPGGGRRRVVDDVSLDLRAGRTTALVGESGCGKSMTALATLGLAPGGARVESGTATLERRDGSRADLLALEPRGLRAVRGREIAFVFQEPMSSLNPVLTVGEQIVEAVLVHERVGRRGARDRARDALREVGLPGARLGAYPHEFSGGMRQRVMIAMALALRARLLLADEPTTALDATVQQQVLDVIDAARLERGLGVLLITHDLGLVAQRADEVLVMYAGRIVESAPTAELFARPAHPYTRALLECTPSLAQRRERLPTVGAIVDDPGAWAPVRTGAGPASPWWPTRGELVALAEVGPGHLLAVAPADVSS